MISFAAPTTLRHPRSDVTCCATARDLSILATGCENGTIYVWEINSGTLVLTLAGGHEGRVNAVSFNKDAVVLASGGEDGGFVWWFVGESFDAAEAHPSNATGKPHEVVRRKLDGHGGAAITCLTFAPNFQMIATGGKDCDVMLWGNMGRPIHNRFRSHTSWVTAVVFNPAATVVASASFDHSVVLWDAVHFEAIRTIRHHDSAVLSLAMSVEGTVVASGDSNGTVLLCRVSDGVCLRVLRGHEDSVNGLAFLDTLGLVVTGSADSTVKVWELRGKCIKSFRAHTAPITAICASSLDDMLVTTGEDHCARVFPYVWKPEE